MNYDVIIQARMTSKRLPGKVLKKIDGIPILELVIRRLEKSRNINRIIVATTTNEIDRKIAELTHSLGKELFAGDEENVLSRYFLTARKYNSENIVRITSDCPLIDPKIIDDFIDEFEIQNKINRIDYLSNKISPTFPVGQDVEIFTFDALNKANKNAKLKYQLEHVTPYFYENDEQFSIFNVVNDIDLSMYRMTLDTVEDLRFIEAIYSHFDNIHFDLSDILEVLKNNPNIVMINNNVYQKKYYE